MTHRMSIIFGQEIGLILGIKMKIVIINGAAESGKDLFVKICRQWKGRLVESLSTVDMIKDILIKAGLWDGKVKGEKERRLMSDVKDAVTRYNNGPFHDIVRKVAVVERCYRFAVRHHVKRYVNVGGDMYQASIISKEVPEPVVFVHCREPEEIQKFKDYYGDACTTLLIDATKRQEKTYGNHADQRVANYTYDHIVDNNRSKEEFEGIARAFMNIIFKKL